MYARSKDNRHWMFGMAIQGPDETLMERLLDPRRDAALPTRLGSYAECRLHEAEIRTALAKGVPVKRIWRAFKNSGRISTQHEAFRARLLALGWVAPKTRAAPPHELQNGCAPHLPLDLPDSPAKPEDDRRFRPKSTLGMNFRPNPTPDLSKLV